MPWNERATIISALHNVDRVINFNDDDNSATDAIRKVKEMFPDWELMFYVPIFMKQDGYYDGIYLSNAFNTNDNEEPRNVEKDFENISERVRRSSVIPREKKIGRAIVPAKFRFIP
jgi:hypothetical protein